MFNVQVTMEEFLVIKSDLNKKFSDAFIFKFLSRLLTIIRHFRACNSSLVGSSNSS